MGRCKTHQRTSNKINRIETVYWLSDFERIFQEVATQCDTFYFNTNEHYRQAVETQTREDRFIAQCKANYPAHKVAKSNPILQQLRAVKAAEEINQIQTACDITEKGFRRLLHFVQPEFGNMKLKQNCRTNSYAIVQKVLPIPLL